MRSDGMLPYEFIEGPTKCDVTGYAGALPYIDLACVLGVLREIDQKVRVCGKQGWMDRHHVLALILLNPAGGECVEDIRMLESDAGLCRVFRDAARPRAPCAYGTLSARFRKRSSRGVGMSMPDHFASLGSNVPAGNHLIKSLERANPRRFHPLPI